jgi:serine/threonine-protein kinase
VSRPDQIRISPGDVLDDFEILEVIASGGSSTTFRAKHRALAREVSLKFVHPVMFSGDGGAIDAARADATRIARLEHPGVAPVFAAGAHEGGLYIASAMPKGRTLAELGAERAISPAQAARVLADVAAALEAAHEQGVVHRDLRPESVTVDRWGHGVVRDFGVTRTSGRTGLLTRAEVLDSMRYTAPELILGRPATPAADVYELAALAVWCLTGAPPYRDRPAAEYVVFRASAPPPTLAQPDGTPATTINTVLKAGMALEPDERPSPCEFAGALEYAISHLPAEHLDAGCPLRTTELDFTVPEPLAVPGAAQPAAERTRAEHRRPLPAAPAAAATVTPWNTYLACAMLAVTAGIAGLLAGGASATKAPAPIRVGAITLVAGDTWRRVAPTGASKLAGAHLAGAPGETAVVGVLAGARLPGDPVPAAILPNARSQPRPTKSSGIQLVSYPAAGSRVVARPTTRGTIVALCSGSTVGRCAALVTRADGPGRNVAVTADPAVTAVLRTSMTAIARATRVATAELRGPRIQRSGAASRLAAAVRDATTGLEVARADRATAAQLERVRAALTEQADALEDLGGAIDRQSDVAFDAAADLVRAGRRKLTAGLAGFRRAGYPVGT